MESAILPSHIDYCIQGALPDPLCGCCFVIAVEWAELGLS